MGFFKSSDKKEEKTKTPLKKVNITELLKESEKSKEIQSVEVPVSKDFSSIPQQNPEKDYLAGSNATYKQIFDKDGLSETRELPRSLIANKKDVLEDDQSVLIFGVSGSDKRGPFYPVAGGDAIPELEEGVVEDAITSEANISLDEIVEKVVKNKEIVQDGQDEVKLENSSEDKEEVIEENLEDGEDMKIETIQVPRVFNNWHEQADKAKSVFEVYAEIEASKNEKLIAWVHDNQNEFAKIWLGSLIPELETQYYITKIANYEQISPNLLVRTAEGQYMIKTNADILDTDVTNLTEEEIRKDWGYLFDNGFSELIED